MIDSRRIVDYHSFMEVRIDDPELDDLETNVRARPKFPTGVIRAFRKRLWQIRAAHDERDFRENRGFKFESYHEEDGHYSIRINDQYRLIFRFEQQSGEKTVVVVAIKDYHKLRGRRKIWQSA